MLVLKYLYEFFDPDRYDVVVFKNPVDPIGPSQNYIKRLVGLPDEHVDGDIFTARRADIADFRIVRPPGFVQEAIWHATATSSRSIRWPSRPGSTTPRRTALQAVARFLGDRRRPDVAMRIGRFVPLGGGR